MLSRIVLILTLLAFPSATCLATIPSFPDVAATSPNGAWTIKG